MYCGVITILEIILRYLKKKTTTNFKIFISKLLQSTKQKKLNSQITRKSPS